MKTYTSVVGVEAIVRLTFEASNQDEAENLARDYVSDALNETRYDIELNSVSVRFAKQVHPLDKWPWVLASDASVADLCSDDYPYCLAFNELWGQPKVRMGYYDQLNRDEKTGNFIFRELHGTLADSLCLQPPTHVMRGPRWPADHDGLKTDA